MLYNCGVDMRVIIVFLNFLLSFDFNLLIMFCKELKLIKKKKKGERMVNKREIFLIFKFI